MCVIRLTAYSNSATSIVAGRASFSKSCRKWGVNAKLFCSGKIFSVLYFFIVKSV